MFRRVMLLSCLVFFIFGAGAHAQYPEKPIRLIVPFAPGGAVDSIARIVSQHMSSTLGESIIVENKTGAGSMVGTGIAARSEPDGYTISMATASAMVINPLLHDLPYVPLRDFEPIALVGVLPFVIVSGAHVPASNLKEFIDYAKASPDELAIASSGVGTPHHISGEMLQQAAGIHMVHVPYRGSGPALVDMVGEQVDVMNVEILAALPYLNGGKVRALAIASEERHRLAPDIPTTAEAGMPDFIVKTWYGMVAPKGVAPEVIDALANSVNRAIQSPEVQEQLARAGVTPVGGTPQEFGEFMEAERVKWTGAVQHASISLK